MSASVTAPPEQKCGGPASVDDLIPQATPKTSATSEAGTKECRLYKPLPEEFRRDEFDYRLIAREGNSAIYQQTWSGCRNPSVSYEVVRIRCRDGFQIGCRFVEAGEVYPNCEAWGIDGWTVVSRDTAFEKLREISR